MPGNLAAVQAVFFVVLLFAVSVFDLRRRIIPDMKKVAIAASALLCFSPAQLWGVFIALPFLLAAVLWGGMGGGDIKLMASLRSGAGLTQRAACGNGGTQPAAVLCGDIPDYLQGARMGGCENLPPCAFFIGRLSVCLFMTMKGLII